MSKPPKARRRVINKAADQRFALRNQRESPDAANRRGKSLMDLPDTPRRRKTAQGVRRTQLGRTLPQGELASRDPVREK
jgi:hypothetical protein